MLKKDLVRYFKFKGRAPRSEMWKVTLIGSFLPIIPMMLLTILIANYYPSSLQDDRATDGIMLLSILPFYPMFFATITRRMHDLNWKGWWIFLFPFEMLVFQIGSTIFDKTGVFYWWMWVFVPPLICSHILIIYGMFALLLGKGTDGVNDYGADPLKS